MGAGPAGLTAALYLGRFRRTVLVVHDGTARALRIPLTHNAPGFGSGITGPDLVERMTDHAVRYGAVIDEARIVAALRERGTFVLSSQAGDTWRARSLILATGLHLNQIPLDAATHQAAIEAGVLRYCPICDGYEHIGACIGVVGSDTQGAAEALFLRRYSDDITLIPKSHAELSPSERGDLDRAGIKVIASAACDYSLAEDAMSVTLEDGTVMSFDVVYPALGSRPRTRLAKCLGIKFETNGCLPADTPFETAVPGLYSAGDVVDGLDQISVAIAHGAIAATKAHNWLREVDGEGLSGTPQ